MDTLTDRLADAIVAEHAAIMERERILLGTDRYADAEAEVDRLADETDALIEDATEDEIAAAEQAAAERCDCCKARAFWTGAISNYVKG